jgi:tRNA (cmo5U34)-methyltransferase
LHPFTFNQAVVDVFPDMINRSVPGYQTIVDGIGKIAKNTLADNSHVYDLGCSTGSVSLSIAKQCAPNALRISAIDNSEAMVKRCRQHIASYRHCSTINVSEGDITNISLLPCNMAVINFTLQFISQEHRQKIVSDIYRALEPGGICIISEKIKANSESVNHLLIDLHHDFKRDNGYSDLEISQKRSALEDVMILDTLDTHLNRMRTAGFTEISTWYQNLNFASMVAIK